MAGLVSKLACIPELIKLENAIFVLPFTYIGMLLAPGFTLVKLIIVTIALISARASGFAANRYFGREYDARNPKKRNWSSIGTYSKADLIVVFVVFALIFEASAIALNTLAAILAPFVLLVVILEPQAKKYTVHRHLILGFVIGLAIIGGYIGTTGAFPGSPALYVLLAGYTLFSASNDIIYTISHVDFDRKNGLKTYPVKYGLKKSMDMSFSFHLWSSGLFMLFGLLIGSRIVLLAALITMSIYIMEQKNLLEGGNSAVTSSFFGYNAAVSLLMLFSVVAAFVHP